MVENIVRCHGENIDLESDCSLYSIFYLSSNSLFGLSFNLNAFRISFSHRRVTLTSPTLPECFPYKWAYENPWAFQKEDNPAFLCYYYWHNELETSFPRNWSWEEAT